MVDDLRSEDGLGGFDGQHRRVRRTEQVRPLADREVPLAELPRLTSEAVRNEVLSRLKAVGYAWVAVDLAG